METGHVIVLISLLPRIGQLTLVCFLWAYIWITENCIHILDLKTSKMAFLSWVKLLSWASNFSSINIYCPQIVDFQNSFMSTRYFGMIDNVSFKSSSIRNSPDESYRTVLLVWRHMCIVYIAEHFSYLCSVCIHCITICFSGNCKINASTHIDLHQCNEACFCDNILASTNNEIGHHQSEFVQAFMI